MTTNSSKQYIFPITTGRSGTVFLSKLLRENLPDADVFHERLGFLNFGVYTPDASHFTLFNSVGNVPKVRRFWQQKFQRDRQGAKSYHAEISHFLVKAGLLENIDLLDGQIHVVVLKRDIFKILWSYINRFDFYNTGFTWMFTLDHRYPNVIVDPEPFRGQKTFGIPLWYIYEIFTRAEYYRLLLQDHPRVTFHDVTLEMLITPAGAAKFLQRLGVDCDAPSVQMPPKENPTKHWFFGENVKSEALIYLKQFKFQPVDLARQYFESGRRLGAPSNQWTAYLAQAKQQRESGNDGTTGKDNPASV